MSEPISSAQQDLAAEKENKCAQNECPCETPLGNIAHNGIIDIYDVSEVQCGQSCEANKSSFVCVNSKLYPESLAVGSRNPDTDYLVNKHYTCKAQECASCLVGNSIIKHGESAPFYSSSQLDCNQTCESVKQSRTCSNGDLDGDDLFINLTCEERDCKCRLPDNSGYLSLDGTMTFFSKETVKCGESCDTSKLDRKCISSGSGATRTFSFNGSTTFKFQSCTEPSEASCYCNLPNYGGIVNGAAPIVLYTKSSIKCGEQIEPFSFEFKCENNVILRNGQTYDPTSDPKSASTFYYSSFRDNCTGCKTPWGKTIPIGSKVMAFQIVGQGAGTCGVGCKKQERTCLESGVLDGSIDYDSELCTNLCSEEGGGAPPQVCLLPWQNSYVTPGAKIPMWKRNTVACGESCQTHYKLGTCMMDTGTFDAGIEYIHKSCTELCP